MKKNLEYTADQMNAKLAVAGRPERWEMDEDGESNSVGTWFCGNTGGVNDAKSMREKTAQLIAGRQ